MSSSLLNNINSSGSNLLINNSVNNNVSIASGGGKVVIGGTIVGSKSLTIASGGGIEITETTDATSVSTGSIISAGGFGVAKSGYFGGKISVNHSGLYTGSQIHVSPPSADAESSIAFFRNTGGTGDTWSLGHKTGSASAGTFGIYNSVFGGNTLTISSSGQIRGLATTNSTSSTTGGAIFDGGVGIAKSLYLGLNLSVIDKNDLPATTDLGYPVLAGNYTSPDSGRLFFGDGTGWKWYISSRTASTTTDLITFTDSGTITMSNSLNATSATVGGSFTSAGGAGIAKRLYVGNSTIVSSSNFSDAPTSNLFTVSGITFTDNTTASSGTVGSWYASTLAQPTYASTNTSVTVTNSATLRISGAPIQGTNTTITNSYALSIGSGRIISGDTTASTSSTTGALILSGGISINNTTDASSATNGGSLTSAGGIAIAKTGYFGGRLHVNTASGITNTQIVLYPSVTDGESSIGFLRDTTLSGEVWAIGHKTNIASAGTFGIYNSVFAGNVLTISNSGQIRGLATTNSTTATSGGAIFDGGVGIAKESCIGGRLHVNTALFNGNPQIYVSPQANDGESSIQFFRNTGETGESWVLGHKTGSASAGTFGIYNASAGGNVLTISNSGQIRGLATTNSTSSTTGGAIFDGGVGIAKDLYSGGNLSVVNNSNLIADAGGSLIISGGYSSPVAGKIIFGDGTGWRFNISKRQSSVTTDLITFFDDGRVSMLNTDNASSSTTGSLTLLGGLGIAKDIYSSGNIILSTSVANNPSISLLNTTGGAGNLVGINLTPWSGRTGGISGAIYAEDDNASGAVLSLRCASGSTSATLTDVLRISSIGNTGVYPATDNTFNLGNGSFRWKEVYSAIGTINTSDRNSKENIEDMENGIEFVKSVRPRKYNLKGDDKVRFGFIAQELLESDYIPENFGGIVKNEFYGLIYTETIAPLYKAIQELVEIVEEQKIRIENLEKK